MQEIKWTRPTILTILNIQTVIIRLLYHILNYLLLWFKHTSCLQITNPSAKKKEKMVKYTLNEMMQTLFLLDVWLFIYTYLNAYNFHCKLKPYYL